MPSKEQKKINKREQNELQEIAVQEKHAEEIEWEKGINTRSILRKQEKDIKHDDKLRRKKERDELLEKECWSYYS